MGARGTKSAASLNVVAATGQRLPVPDDLSEFGKAEWGRIIDSLPADWLRPADAHLLRAYCVAAEVHRRATDVLAREGLTVMTATGTEKAHPASQIMALNASTMANIAVKLRLCPSSRYTAEKAGTRARQSAAVAGRPWQASGG